MARRNVQVIPKPGKARAALTITHPNAAGIDIGSAAHFVAVPPDRDRAEGREVELAPMRLYINDVAVRDGFQMEKTFVPTATKIASAARL